jgi:hypothetical protein
MDADRALERIRKLLAVAKDSRANEGEAANAAAMAARLMAKFSLEEADVLVDEKRSALGDVVNEPIEDTEFVSRLPSYYNRFATFLSRLFHCHSQVRRDDNGKLRFHVFGFSKDVAVVKWLFLYVVDQANKLADERWSTKELPALKAAGLPIHASKRRGWKDGYKSGLLVDVCSRIKEAYEETLTAAGHADGDIKTADGRSLMVVKQDLIVLAMETEFKYSEQDNVPPPFQGFGEGLNDSDRIRINKILDVPEEIDVPKLLENPHDAEA